MKKVVIAFLVVVVVFFGVMPFARHAHLRSMLEADLGKVLFEYNTTTRERFLERVRAMCVRSQIEGEFEVDLTDHANGEFTLTVRYVDRFRLFLLVEQVKPVEIVIRGTRVET